MNIRNCFAILSYIFRMSANKRSYEQFTKELRKNYEKQDRLETCRELRESYKSVTKSLRIVYETVRNSLVTFS